MYTRLLIPPGKQHIGLVLLWWLMGLAGYVQAAAKREQPDVPAPPTTELTISTIGTLTLCQGFVTQIQARIPADFTQNWYWTKDGQRCSGDREPSITLSESGTYTLGGEWKKDPSVAVNGQFELTMLEQPVTLVTASSLTACAGTSFTLTAEPQQASNTYQWLDSRRRVVGDGPVLTTSRADAYVLRVVNPLSCTYVATAPRITTYTSQTVLVQAAGSTTVCEGQTVQLLQSGSEVDNLVWLRNQEPLSGPYSASLTVSESGEYTVKGDGTVCGQAPQSVTVTVIPRPSVQIVPASLALCEGQYGSVMAQTADGNALRWRRDGVAAGTLRSLPASPGSTFSLTVTSPAGCQQTATYAFTPQVFPLPVFELVAPDPGWANAPVQPQNVPEQPGYRYQWLPAAGASDPTSARPQLNPAVATSYTLTITDANGCQYSNQLNLTFLTKLITPTAFSPNGDGQNDTWAPVNLERYPNAEVYIYDRWGSVVYAGRPGDAPFDGTWRGQPLPVGFYTYHIRLHVQQAEVRGRLSLIR